VERKMKLQADPAVQYAMGYQPDTKSILAVLEPAKHDYLFFVAEPGGTGRHAFARTYDEHLKNVERYRQGQ
jgi:cell division protein YceG involved in septum cleavage